MPHSMPLRAAPCNSCACSRASALFDLRRKEGKSIDGTLGPRQRPSGGPSLPNRSGVKTTDRGDRPKASGPARRSVLNGAILLSIALAVATSLAFRGIHAGARQAVRMLPPQQTAVPVARLAHELPSGAVVENAQTSRTGTAAEAASTATPALRVEAVRSAAAAPGAGTPSPSQSAASRSPASVAASVTSTGEANAEEPATTSTRTAASAPTQPAVAASIPRIQYLDHTIVSGETLHSIAAMYDVSLATLMANNQDLASFDNIQPGQHLRIPTTNGLLYSVREGDTVDSISQRFGVSAAVIEKLAANNLQNADAIHPNQTLLIPERVTYVAPPAPAPATLARPIVAPAHVLTPPSRPAVAAAPVAPVPSAEPTAHVIQPPAHPVVAAPIATPAPAPVVAPKPLVPPPAPTAVPVVSRFIWPVSGPITQGFGVPELGVGAPHTGLDIGVPIGTPIKAAGSGTVIFAGGDACCSFGYHVIISHGNGLQTLYGHMSQIGVSVGQVVVQGQILGLSGSTGFSTGPHVHFEVDLNGVPVSPYTYLP